MTNDRRREGRTFSVVARAAGPWRRPRNIANIGEEAQALVLALNTRLPVLMDERRGRLEAERLGVEVVGTGAVLVAAKHKGLVDEVAPLLDLLTQHGSRLSARLRQALLEKSGELT